MAINKILYIDDSFENGMAATMADPRIEFFSSLNQVERPLGEYDCIITDMQMEHSQSGMEVVERALREGRLAFVATGGTYEHGGTFNRVKVFNSTETRTFDKLSKSEDAFWKALIPYITSQYESPVQKALNNVKGVLGIVPEYTIEMLMNGYRKNHQSDK